MKYYKITFSERFNERPLYLYQHDNLLIKGLKDLDLTKHKAILIGDMDYTEIVGIEDFGYVYTEVTESLKNYLLNCGDIEYLGADLFVDYNLQESDPNIDFSEDEDFEHVDYEYLTYITEEEWIKASEKMIEEDLSYTEEQKEKAELFADIIDNFMAKGRESLRAKERGDKYLGGKK